MSEEESPYIHTLAQLHLRTKRTPEEIATAFLDTFTSLNGRVVLEALFDAWGLTQIANERGIGKHDALLEVLDMMAQGHTYRQRGEGWIHERPNSDHS